MSSSWKSSSSEDMMVVAGLKLDLLLVAAVPDFFDAVVTRDAEALVGAVTCRGGLN